MGSLSAPAVAVDPADTRDSDRVHQVETGVVGDWSDPDPSVEVSPHVVAEGVGRKEKVRVVSVVDNGGDLSVVVRYADGAAAARREVSIAQDDSGVIAVEIDTKVSIQTTNDPRQGEVWAMPVLQAEQAWRISTGSGVVVAVIDSGIDGGHPDLQGTLVAGKTVIRGDSSSPSTDVNGHGTHVAGTIAARVNNGVGIAGLAPGSKVMPVKAIGVNGSGYASDVADGIRWAADHGANVLNLSLGGPPNFAMEKAVAYAVSKRVTIVAAAGNGGAGSSGYPGAYPGVISVSALAQPGTDLAGFSNRGSGVDLAAPGQSILSTAPGGYSYLSGTSMAAPYVAAAAALVLAKRPLVNVETELTSVATDLGPPGFDSTFAHGRLNVMGALGIRSMVALQKQAVRLPGRVKVGRNRKLAKRTHQGVRVKGWRSKRPKVCRVTKRSSRWKVRGVRRGKCVLIVVAPSTDKYLRMRASVQIQVR